MLHLYRRLLALRRTRPSLRMGDLALLDCPDGVLGYRRSSPGEDMVILVNFGADPVGVEVPGGPFVVEISSRPDRHGGRWEGRLGADEAVVLGPQPHDQ